LSLSFLRGLGATDQSHDQDVQMALRMVLEGKEKLGIGNFGPFFLLSTERI
jgi:hypothetical protein